MNMHENKLFKFLALLIICISINASAQQPGSTLAQQYDEVVNKAGSYQGHKEIRETKLQALWRNVTDSLQREKQLLIESRAKLAKNS